MAAPPRSEVATMRLANRSGRDERDEHGGASEEILGLGLRERRADARAAAVDRGAARRALRSNAAGDRRAAEPRGARAPSASRLPSGGARTDLLAGATRSRGPHLRQELSRLGSRLSAAVLEPARRGRLSTERKGRRRDPRLVRRFAPRRDPLRR